MTVYSSFEPSVISVVIQRRHVIHLASRQLRLGRNRLRQPDSPARFACELRLYRFGPAEVEAPEIRCSWRPRYRPQDAARATNGNPWSHSYGL